MRIKNLTMSYGTQILFKDVNLFIKENEKIGIVGVNGAGKSTFLKIMAGIVVPDDGEIITEKSTRISYLPQVIDEELLSANMNVLDYLMEARPIEKLNNELQDCYDKLTNCTGQEQKRIYKKIDFIQKKIDYWDIYQAESILLKILNGMSIDDGMWSKKICELSGGQKSKIAFARLLYSKPEIILLDEPTNHLDLKSKEYVINYLKNYKGTVFIISHDINFLNKITTSTMFIDKRTRTVLFYSGNYDRFKKLNEEYEENLSKKSLAQQKEEEKLKKIIDKYAGVSGKRKKMARDREKKLEKLLESKIEVASPTKKAKLELKPNRDGSAIPLKVNDVSFCYNSNNKLLHQISFELDKGEKFLIVGENGIGKSTLLKLIVGILKPDSGSIKLGAKTDIGYYAQEHELLDNNKSVIENFDDVNISQNNLRGVLGKFLFYDDDVFKKVGILSPGERSRIALAKLSLTRANFLVLDEPTNHLDPETQVIIADVFKNFPGTMLVVSHNPEFIDNLGISRILLLPSGKIINYDRKIVENYHEINTNEDRRNIL